MTTQRQLMANIQNAQLSTGPKSSEGRSLVSTNAIKHGIFTKDILLSSTNDFENACDYQILLNNLQDCLMPADQMQSFLVEKIAVDIWRLRRTIRFETGNLAQGITKLHDDFYDYDNPSNEKIDELIHRKRKEISWNNQYVEYLKKGMVSFEFPKWESVDIKSEIYEDLFLIAQSIKNISKHEREMLHSGQLDFEKIQALLSKHGFSQKEKISEKLIEIYMKQNETLEREIQNLSVKKTSNESLNKLFDALGMLPANDNSEKILKYERSLQKSIYQNLLMLKNLQRPF